MIILSTLLLGSCSLNDRSSNDPGTPTGNLPAPTVGTALPEDNDRQEPVDPADPDDPAAPDDPADQKIRSLLDSMTLEEKIGQMLFLAYRQDKDGRNVLKMDNELEEYLSRYKPGGFVLFCGEPGEH